MSRIIGNHYEDLALSYLKRQGLTLITRNFYSRFGEIDLIMREQETLVFIEVRYRQSDYFGSSIESVNWIKQQRLLKTAEYFLLKYPRNGPYRFDVMAINPHNNQSINWIRNAFTYN